MPAKGPMIQPTSRSLRFAGNGLGLPALVLAGCVSVAGGGPTARFKRLEEKVQQISEQARRCKRNVIEETNAEINSMAASAGVLTAEQLQKVEQKRAQKLSKCDTEASREKEALLQRERMEYQLSAQQERDLAALMTQLTASRPR